MPDRNIVEAINNALSEEMERDPRVMVLGLDVGKLGGVVRTTSRLRERFGRERVVDPDPVLYCEPDRLYRLGRSEVPDGAYTVPFGKAAVVREGEHVTLVAWSAAVELCLRAANRLQEEGVSASVLDLRTLVPLDVDTLCSEVAKTGRCVVVHEAPLSAGFGAEFSSTLMTQFSYDLHSPVPRVLASSVPL